MTQEEKKITRMLSDSNNSGMITKQRLKEFLIEFAKWQEKYIIKKLSEFELLSNGDVEDVANESQDPIFRFTNNFIKRFKESLEKE